MARIKKMPRVEGVSNPRKVIKSMGKAPDCEAVQPVDTKAPQSMGDTRLQQRCTIFDCMVQAEKKKVAALKSSGASDDEVARGSLALGVANGLLAKARLELEQEAAKQ